LKKLKGPPPKFGPHGKIDKQTKCQIKGGHYEKEELFTSLQN
jgi:hypothetical protein